MAPLVDGEFEAFGQKIDAAGNEIGDNDFRVSDMGPDGDVRYTVQTPVVLYNGTRLKTAICSPGQGMMMLKQSTMNSRFLADCSLHLPILKSARPIAFPP